MNPLTYILNNIRTNEARLFLSIICVACEAPITTEVLVSLNLGYWHSWITCISLSFTIIYFTIDKSWMALVFAIFETVVCGYFFCNSLGFDWLLIPALGFTFTLPFSIYAYSQGIDFSIPKKSKMDILRDSDELPY